MPKIITKSAGETRTLGKKLAAACRGGEIFGLTGDLGAGKTCLAQGFGSGLGIKSIINSPTFIIMRVHSIRGRGAVKKFCHIDAYRLKTAADLEAIGAREYFGRPDTVVLIEWAEKIKKIWPKKIQLIRMEHLDGDRRKIIY